MTTKFFPRNDDPAAELEHSLRRLGLEYVDLYIIHWPEGGPTWAWPGMETAHDRGHARSIGVSNFSAEQLEAVCSVAESQAPVVNQVQFSPFEYRAGLLVACQERQIALEAYSPLGTGRHLDDPRVEEIARAVERTPAQVLLRWCLQRDAIVIPKSTHRERITENAAIFDFELTDEQLRALDGLDRTGGTDEARESTWW